MLAFTLTFGKPGKEDVVITAADLPKAKRAENKQGKQEK
jgi:hypothetical protein